jgi:hypothetical protein
MKGTRTVIVLQFSSCQVLGRWQFWAHLIRFMSGRVGTAYAVSNFWSEVSGWRRSHKEIRPDSCPLYRVWKLIFSWYCCPLMPALLYGYRKFVCNTDLVAWLLPCGLSIDSIQWWCASLMAQLSSFSLQYINFLRFILANWVVPHRAGLHWLNFHMFCSSNMDRLYNCPLY